MIKIEILLLTLFYKSLAFFVFVTTFSATLQYYFQVLFYLTAMIPERYAALHNQKDTSAFFWIHVSHAIIAKVCIWLKLFNSNWKGMYILQTHKDTKVYYYETQ